MLRKIVMMGLLALAGGVEPGLGAIDVRTGLPGIGDSLAELTGLDQSGMRRTAASLVGREGAVVTFLRSADWCPSCKVQLVELEAARAALGAAGYGLAGVTIDDVPVLARFAAERKIGFPLLAGRKAIADFAMVDQRFDADEGRRGAPVPAVYVIDRSLVVRRIFPESERQTVASMLAHLGIGAGAVSKPHETRHLTATSWNSDQEVNANRRFSLGLDVSPKPTMHVYAPGDHRYRSVRLTLDRLDGLAVSPMEFPPSQPYVIKELNETVPIYGKPFRLIQDVSIARTARGATAVAPRTVRITGRLEYQACDDLVCYPSTTVPLEWKVQVK